MPTLRAAVAVVVLTTACEHQDELVPAPSIVAPESPPLETIETASTEREPPPPKAAPVAPDLVNIPGRLRGWFAGLDREEKMAVRTICRMRREDPCAGMMPTRKGAPPHPINAAFATLGERAFDDKIDRFCRHTMGGINVCDTPLVVAFDGEPITFTPATGVAFAFSGTPTITDWPAATTPWIALDRDGDGAITSGAELFGNATVLPDGATAKHGYEAIAALDDNGDGAIDWQDRAFTSLVLWADTNGDRTSSPSELTPLASTVTRIPLAYTTDPRCTNGNCEGERGAMQWRDANGAARTGAVVDVYLVAR